MANHCSKKATKRHLLPTLLTITASVAFGSLLPACAPQAAKSSPVSGRISTASETSATCEALIKQRILANNGLTLLGSDDDILQMMKTDASFQSLGNASYNLTTVKNQINGMGITYDRKTADAYFAVGYTLKTPDADANSVLDVEMVIDKTTPQQMKKITEKFSADKNCVLTLGTTETEIILRNPQGSYRNITSSKYSDGGQDSKPTDFKVDSDLEYVDLNIEDQTSATTFAKDKGASFDDEAGLLVFHFTAPATKSVSAFGLKIELAGNSFHLDSDGSAIITGFHGQDKNTNIRYLNYGPEESWDVPSDIWNKQVLASSADSNSLEMKLPKDYLINNWTWTLTTNALPSYDHIDAYWTPTKTQTTSNGLFEFSAHETYPPVINAPSGPEDLVSNDTIQTQLPAIQAIRKQILAVSPNGKAEDRIRLILDYLSKHYKFDIDMGKNNVVRPLTTDEALSRGKGVCQHYAVIFTAIARSLAIPSRIVEGYLLQGDAPGMHAWVEAEVKPGVWQVIEPQLAAGLKDTYPRFYFPLSRAKDLEDKSVTDNEIVSLLFNNTYTIAPAN